MQSSPQPNFHLVAAPDGGFARATIRAPCVAYLGAIKTINSRHFTNVSNTTIQVFCGQQTFASRSVTKYCRIAKIMAMANVDVRFWSGTDICGTYEQCPSPEGGHPI